MWRTSAILLFLALPGLLCCGRRHAPVPHSADRASIEQTLERFQRFWLDPAGVAPAAIAFTERVGTSGSITVRTMPIRPEDAAWNEWPGRGARLFNNRAAYLFEVTIEGEGLLRWLPDQSSLELNVEGHPLAAADSPEELLRPVLAAALDQERYVLDGDFVERTRAAGPFRASYMPVSEQAAVLRGVIAFPLEDGDLHVVGLRVTVGVRSRDGVQQIAITYD